MSPMIPSTLLTSSMFYCAICASADSFLSVDSIVHVD